VYSEAFLKKKPTGTMTNRYTPPTPLLGVTCYSAPVNAKFAKTPVLGAYGWVNYAQPNWRSVNSGIPLEFYVLREILPDAFVQEKTYASGASTKHNVYRAVVLGSWMCATFSRVMYPRHMCNEYSVYIAARDYLAHPDATSYFMHNRLPDCFNTQWQEILVQDLPTSAVGPCKNEFH
jgi:hypothetical protein